uniref:Uncharacterized protein n=1 Tax=Romanomermis culicivorax TaxID=13658 RepID=A0A915K5E9_ROMCU
MAASKITENAAQKKASVIERNQITGGTANKTVASPRHVLIAPKKGESPAAPLFGGAGPGPTGVDRSSFTNQTLPLKVNLLANDDTAAVAMRTPALEKHRNSAGTGLVAICANFICALANCANFQSISSEARPPPPLHPPLYCH